ncbi:hypothetical protein [Desulfosporosinus sp.]|uniref:hypothetical protein n=1 Tax=Desulfosporosinus sp. TaxID=157907 RepID=UPI00263602E7|nr:hypothetical protein [Desulfosporosinus sp.]
MYPADVLWRIYANDDRGLCQPFSWLSCEQKNRIVQKGGNRELRRDVLVYNLDAIISVSGRTTYVIAAEINMIKYQLRGSTLPPPSRSEGG